MTYIIMAYSDSGYQEFILPEINNTDYKIVIDHVIHSNAEDIDIKFDVMDGKWRLLGLSRNAVLLPEKYSFGSFIEPRSSFKIRQGGATVLITIEKFDWSLGSAVKYTVPEQGTVSVGTDGDNDIVCSENSGIARRHFTLNIFNGSVSVSAAGDNMLYLNGRRVRGSVNIRFGDVVNAYGIKIVWLGNVMSVSSLCGKIACSLNRYSYHAEEQSFSDDEPSSQHFFVRSPRYMPKLLDEQITIDPPPQPQMTEKKPLILTIGPSLTMSIPMMAGTGIAILGSRSGGSSAGLFMYTGVIIAVLSALIGTMWAVINVRYAKKTEKEHEALRMKKYREYLEDTEKDIAEKYLHNEQNLSFMYPSAETAATYGEGSSELWNRNVNHADFLFVRLGLGAMPFQCNISVPQKRFSLVDDSLAARPYELSEKYRILKNVPVGINLKDKKIVGIVGKDRNSVMSVVRSMLIQIVSGICYTDLKTAFITDGSTPTRTADWGYAKWFPHTWTADRRTRLFSANEGERSEVCFYLAGVLRAREEEDSPSKIQNFRPHFAVFVDGTDLLDGEPVSKYLLNSEGDLGATTFLIAERVEQLPNNCSDIIRCDKEFCGYQDLTGNDQTLVDFDSVSKETSEAFARSLSGITVREIEDGGEIPNSLTFLDMYGVSKISDLKVSERWLKSRIYENIRVPIGKRSGGAVWNLDIHEKYHGPHGLVAGTTGSGKSETLQTYILSLAVNFSPEDIAFFIIDFKGGGMANLFEKLPHTAGCISNLSGNQIRRAMVSIKSENRRRQRIFGEFGVNHIDQYTKLYKNGEADDPIPHLFIVIDEFAELKRDEPDFMRELISVAQVGRSLGVHLILATQKPSGTVDDNIWSNTRFKLCLRVQDRQDSNDVLHKPDAAYLTQAGRCYMQVGNDEVYELFQSGWSGAVYDEDFSGNQADIASLIENTGKSAASGTGHRAKIIEEKRNKWLSCLVTAIRNNSTESGTDIKGIYEETLRDGYDYSENDANTEKLVEFISAATAFSDVSDTEKAVYGIISGYELMNRQLPEPKEKTQLGAIVEYLARLAKSQGLYHSFRLWLPILKTPLYLFDVVSEEMYDGEKWPENHTDGTISVPVGMYDDPAHQIQRPYVINFSENGHLAVCGSVVSGKSTFLQTLLYALVNKYSPKELNIYAVDFSNHLLEPFDKLAHCGGVVFDNEPDKLDKLFVLLSQIISDRKAVLRGGSFSQYIKSHGSIMPHILFVIDNYTSFREKTEDKYESDITSLSREGANYGVYLAVSAGGFGASEIQSRIADNFRNVCCLEMGDRFKYNELLRASHIEVFPESGIKGRGITGIDGQILEYQTALSMAAEDDYDRAEKLRVCFREMNSSWQGKFARKIPAIPANPTWSDFVADESCDFEAAEERGKLLFGWDFKKASVIGIDLSRTYCWVINGKARTGKTNLIKILAMSAVRGNSDVMIFELSGNRLKKFAEEIDVRYIGNDRDMFLALKSLTGEFSARNLKKRELTAAGAEDEDIFRSMREFKPIFLFIDDLGEFTKSAYEPSEGVGDMHGFLENIAEKGYLHNIYIITSVDSSRSSAYTGYKMFNTVLSYKTGIHLGGNVAAQRLFDFSALPYTEQPKATKPGVGLIPPNEYYPEICETVIPNVKGDVKNDIG